MTSPVARYYDRNTLRFLLVGRASDSWAIHRQLWGEGVTTARDAANHVNVLLERELRSLSPADPETILDLGCGVGGTLFHLGRRFPGSRLHGVTISARQVEIARRLARKVAARVGPSSGPGDRWHFAQADFQTMRLGVRADVALAVESFVHSASPAAFFAGAAAHLKDGGHLLLVDDFLAREEAALDEAGRARVDAFRRGWHAASLCTVEACVRAAGGAGLELVRDADHTDLIRLGRPRDRWIRRLAPTFRRLGLEGIPFFGNMIGGDALQWGLGAGVIRYRMLTFRCGG